MEDIIQILIFGVIMIFTVIIKSLKSDDKQETSSPKEVLEDLFPDKVEVPEKVELEPVTCISNPKPVFQETEVVDEVYPMKPASHIVSVPILKKEKEIRFQTKQDARRAFIYSEIFNQKY